MFIFRYKVNEKLKEELLFSSELKTTIKTKEIMSKVDDDFFEKENMSRMNLYEVCTNGGPAILEIKSEFQKLVQKKTPNVVTTQCFIHRKTLVSKTLPDGLKCAFDLVIKIVNYMKSSVLNFGLFLKLCENLNSDRKYLPYHTKVRWLSRGNVVARVFKFRDEIKIFLQTEKPKLAVYFENGKVVSRLTYLANIFEALNQLNLKMQGKSKDIIQFVDFTNGFIEKLGN